MFERNEWLCPIEIKLSDSAHYSPARDQIVLPAKLQYKQASDAEGVYRDGMSFYATALHEMTHSTGTANRLNRDLSTKFGSPKYAKEELVAELTAAIVGQQLGFDKKISDDNVKYLNGWINILKEEPRFILNVLGDVGKASTLIMEQINMQKQKLEEKQAQVQETSRNKKVDVEFNSNVALAVNPSQEQQLASKRESESLQAVITPATPPLAQPSTFQQVHDQVKAQYPDALIVYREGSNYAIYSKDSEKAAEVLKVGTERITNKQWPDSVERLEFPYARLEDYLRYLVRAGYRVALHDNPIQPTLDIKDATLVHGKDGDYAVRAKVDGKDTGLMLIDKKAAIAYLSTHDSTQKESLLQDIVARAFNNHQSITQQPSVGLKR